MNPFTYLLLVLMVTIGVLISSATGTAGEVFILSDQPSQIIQEQIASSTLLFCRNSGGIVHKTDQENIYICCYEFESKCVVTDTKRLVSWPIPFSDREQFQRKSLIDIDKQ